MKILINGKEVNVVDENGMVVDITNDKLFINNKEIELPKEEKTFEIIVMGDCKEINSNNLIVKHSKIISANVNGSMYVEGDFIGNADVKGSLMVNGELKTKN